MFSLFLLLPSVLRAENFSDPGKWQTVSDTHFIVSYPVGTDSAYPHSVLVKAEADYQDVSDKIGYARYRDFWTWNARVPIVLYKDQKAYAKGTGQPNWSQGMAAVGHLSSIKRRMIISYLGQSEFYDGVLPHEIAHLIFHDFVGDEAKIPVWLDEGIAQQQQPRQQDTQRKILARLAAAGKLIPFEQLDKMDIRHSKDENQVSIFYAESLYIVDFLIKTYGSDSFREFCRFLRDGASWPQAMQRAYYPTIDSIDALQLKWQQDLMNYLY